jgi:CDGSH-type Zn-finger protein
MSDVTIKAREHGPFLVTGPVTLTDHLGNVYHTAGQATIALCRCGQSQKKPFCDGSHKGCGFQAGELAPPPPPANA